MKTAMAVIGAGYGDEGKGLTTDYLAARQGGDALVVRYNGGAQAGHTVTLPEGRRHVFSHFGSGSFSGADTLLSRFFVCNPLLFVKEQALLREKSLRPAVYVDASAPVTTPYDMMINQIAEEARGAARHGSCGMGFGETLQRGEEMGPLPYAALFDLPALKTRLEEIRQRWLPARLQALGIQDLSPAWRERISSNGVLQKFLDDTAEFLAATRPAAVDFLEQAQKPVIFEGAQGLLLDQTRGRFPHVTRSHTGLRNIVALAGAAGIDALEVFYITRSYLTRHGAGPLVGELYRLPYPAVRDETNVPNDYQGALRFAYLDLDTLKTAIDHDLADHAAGLRVTPGIALTCLDQLEDRMHFRRGEHLQTGTAAALPAILGRALNLPVRLQSRGPTRFDVTSDAA